MNYDKLKQDLTIIGFIQPWLDLIIEAVSNNTELRQSIAEVQGEIQYDILSKT